jgi:hypothetical protein
VDEAVEGKPLDLASLIEGPQSFFGEGVGVLAVEAQLVVVVEVDWEEAVVVDEDSSFGFWQISLVSGYANGNYNSCWVPSSLSTDARAPPRAGAPTVTQQVRTHSLTTVDQVHNGV